MSIVYSISRRGTAFVMTVVKRVIITIACFMGHNALILLGFAELSPTYDFCDFARFFDSFCG